MIVLAAMLMAGSAAAPAAPTLERKALGTCLSKFVHDKLPDKMEVAAFRAAAKTACGTQVTAFRTAWINYDVAMRTRRSEAEQNADSQVDDYLQNSSDSYVDATVPAKPRPAAAAAPAVTPASSTTPPKP